MAAPSFHYFDDLPEIKNWVWPDSVPAQAADDRDMPKGLLCEASEIV
jgi:hypothetical protein